MSTQPTPEQMAALFQAQAVRGTRKARIGLVGPSGSGKTYTLLRMATGLAAGGKIGLIDTEHKTSQLYADDFNFWPVYMAAPYTPQRYIGVIEAAKMQGLPVLGIDSLSHAWSGAGGVLEQVDTLTGGNQSKTREAWKAMTPIQQQLIEAILSYPGHVIVTMRTKDAYGQDPENPRKRVKVGLAPVQRNEVDYEFDVIMYLDQQHTGTVEKSRVSKILPVNASFAEPGEKEAQAVAAWLSSGEAREPSQTPPPATEAPPAAAPPPSGPQPGDEPGEVGQGDMPAPGVPPSVEMIDPDGVQHWMPAGSVAALLGAGWQVRNGADPTPAASATDDASPAPTTAQNGAETAAASGTSDSPITAGQVTAISEQVEALRAVDAAVADRIPGHLEKWYGEGVGITELTQAQAQEVLDRIAVARRAAMEKAGAL